MSSTLGYEIDFLPVGNGDRSGDAIAMRYGIPGNYKVLVYDGGTKEAGEALVEHIREYYGTERVDYVVSSHPDGDHASGLSVVIEKLEIGELWMHRPWNYSPVILDYFKDGRMTDKSLAEKLKEKMGAAYALEELATRRGIAVLEPFQGASIGGLFVMSPQKEWYVHNLIAEFSKSPEQKRAEEEASLSRTALVLKLLAEAKEKVAKWIAEAWGIEWLREDVATTAENESSVVLFGNLGGRCVLLTGDAGIQALTAAADFADACGVELSTELKFIQVPHHGSRHNVSTSVLDRLIGQRKAVDDGRTKMTAFISSGKESTTHPRKMVVNAFIRRGARVIATQGTTKRHWHNMPARTGWSAADPLAFSTLVEGWE